MPTPPRRRPAAGPPARRPRVAGLRRPAARPEPQTPEPDDVEPGATGGRTADTPEGDTRPACAPAANAECADAERADTVTDSAVSAPPPVESGSATVDAETEPDEPDDEQAAPVVTDGVLTAAPSNESGESHKNSPSLDIDDEGAAERPSPTGKRRAGGRAAPADLRVAERSASGLTRRNTSADPGRVALNLGIGMAVAALLLAALGLYFKGQADRLTSGVDQANTAFVDAAATAEVKTKIIAGLERALSYDYRDLDRTATAVREVLAGKAVCEYDAMFGQLREVAPAQKLVHTTIVRELGVRSLTADRAEALVFIDQTSTRVEQGQTTASGAQLGVAAERVDGTWKITEFDTFSQPLPNGEPLPEC